MTSLGMDIKLNTSVSISNCMVYDVSSSYLHKTERTTNAFRREELGFSAGCSALQPIDAWLS